MVTVAMRLFFNRLLPSLAPGFNILFSSEAFCTPDSLFFFLYIFLLFCLLEIFVWYVSPISAAVLGCSPSLPRPFMEDYSNARQLTFPLPDWNFPSPPPGTLTTFSPLTPAPPPLSRPQRTPHSSGVFFDFCMWTKLVRAIWVQFLWKVTHRIFHLVWWLFLPSTENEISCPNLIVTISVLLSLPSSPSPSFRVRIDDSFFRCDF